MEYLGPKKHNSTADWDFLKASDWSVWDKWGLNAYMAVSPPTCLWFNPWFDGGDKYVLSNLPDAQDLKAGILITWHCRQLGGVGATKAYIGVTGVGSLGIAIGLPSINLSMKRNRLVWWQDVDDAEDPITKVRLDSWIDDEWTEGVAWEYPPMAGAINRVGLGATPQGLSAQKYFDDTEIWKRC